MTDEATAELETFMNGLIRRNPGEPEFHQTVQEVAETLMPFILQHPQYREACILERMTEPDRIIIFRVCWEDDQGKIRTNRAWRVQFNNSIGPYKGGMRFHPSVNQSILKFLGFEQCFKNALTTLPMGGAKGGSNFNPKGKSEREVMRFCQSLMIELHRHIGEDTDVPAGDIGVGSREISYMFGQYKRLNNRFAGVMTGKGLTFGGSPVRIEATGYGLVYFMEDMLKEQGESIEGKTAAVSGSGNVALYCIEKLIQQGVKVITASDSGGSIHDPEGITLEKLEWLKDLKEERRGRISEYAEAFGCEYHAEAKPWHIPCDLAFPCATQNEIDVEDARALIQNGLRAISEGSNMPSVPAAIQQFQKANILFAPSKAANAGGVAVSGLEQTQNTQRLVWTREEVDTKLRAIMKHIHDQCVAYGKDGNNGINYLQGANTAGFVKIADSMLAYGIV